jgi:hypothetical protein
VIWGAVFFGSTVGVSALISSVALPTAVRYALPLICIIGAAGYFLTVIRDMRTRSDELELRINLEAALTACLGMFGALMVYPVARKAGIIPEAGSSVALFVLCGLFFVGYFSARRRYR